MVKQAEAESYYIMLGKFSKNTPEYANKRKYKAESILEKVQVEEGDYLVVTAGPFSKADADENLARLAEQNMEGYIYLSSDGL